MSSWGDIALRARNPLGPIQLRRALNTPFAAQQHEIRAGTKNSHQPAENVSKRHSHGKKSYLKDPPRQLAKGLILRVYEVLTRDNHLGG